MSNKCLKSKEEINKSSVIILLVKSVVVTEGDVAHNMKKKTLPSLHSIIIIIPISPLKWEILKFHIQSNVVGLRSPSFFGFFWLLSSFASFFVCANWSGESETPYLTPDTQKWPLPVHLPRPLLPVPYRSSLKSLASHSLHGILLNTFFTIVCRTRNYAAVEETVKITLFVFREEKVRLSV